MIWKALKTYGGNAAYFLVFGRFLARAHGARLLSKGETAELLSSRNTGLLLDGQDGRLSERESFQNVCVVARVGAGKTSRYIIPNVLDKSWCRLKTCVRPPGQSGSSISNRYACTSESGAAISTSLNTQFARCVGLRPSPGRKTRAGSTSVPRGCNAPSEDQGAPACLPGCRSWARHYRPRLPSAIGWAGSCRNRPKNVKE